jgi:SAM-dependent methyltransferase
MTPHRLLPHAELENSPVVANNAMNRERGLAGVNSYAKDLGFDPLQRLRAQLADGSTAAWLDLCCGAGLALIQATELPLDGLSVTGVDLVGYFARHSPRPNLTLVASSLTGWQPEHPFDLITCVHGLHYVGDKLGVLARALSWLSATGYFAAHLDLANIKVNGSSRPSAIRHLLRTNGIDYDSRRRLVTCRGPARLDSPYEYLGADDTAGPNYTGQPAVDSHYRPARP